MGYEAEIVLDSIGPNGARLTSVRARFPRFILSEILTHRQFSRNGKSSRAKPASKLVAEVRSDPVEPLYWGRNKRGMQAGAEEIKYKKFARWIWLSLMRLATSAVLLFDKMGLHKQWANRVIGPWLFMDMLITATDWDNFFHLRCHKDAQPEMQKIASMICWAYINSIPQKLSAGQWHLPYISTKEKLNYTNDILLKFSTSRCARISYKNFDGSDANPEKDLQLYEKLVISEPVHSSPTEHQGLACPYWQKDIQSGNFKGYIQYRKTIENETCKKFDYEKFKIDYANRDYIV